MPTYRWSGVTHEHKKISGIKYATNRIELKNNLIKQNIFPLKIKYDLTRILSSYSKIRAKHITHLIEQLSILINANTPIVKAFDIMSQDTENHKLKELIINCKNSILEGKSLYHTWQQYPQYFNALSCNLINAAEQSGTLDILLNELTNYLKKSELEKRKIIKALLYPTVTLSITIVVTLILLIFVIPQFESMFNNFGAKLPTYTQLIVCSSHFLQKYWPIFLSSIAGVTISVTVAYHHLTKFHQLLDLAVLKLPLIKNILTYVIITRLTKILSLTLKSGIPLVTVMNLATSTISHWQYRSAIQNAITLITNGKTLHNAMQEQKIFPTKVIQLIALGEETGTLDSMLAKIADIYNTELNNITDNLNTLLEPIIMLILGVVVGGLVIGMYLPIFRLGTII